MPPLSTAHSPEPNTTTELRNQLSLLERSLQTTDMAEVAPAAPAPAKAPKKKAAAAKPKKAGPSVSELIVTVLFRGAPPHRGALLLLVYPLPSAAND